MRHFFTKMKTEQIYDLYRNSTGIATDSRSVGKAQLFFALWGENFNGNIFASAAIEKGASWAVIDDSRFETERTILVEDCLLEFQALAAFHRKHLKIPVVAITGTNGKTTTKELMAAVLSEKFRVHYTKGNLNNHIGVPLTILSAPDDTELMIIEMGANHTGEIKTLCNIAQPDFGIITNIGTAHIEGFGSFEGVVKAKSELYDYLRKVNGIALYNDKDPLLTEKIYKYVNRAIPYSDPDGIPLTLKQESSGMNLILDVSWNHQNFKVKTNLFGSYNLWNVKAAMATGIFFGVKIEDIVMAIESYQPSNNRSQIKVTEHNTIICDSYNANPSSMKSALEAFALIKEPRLAVLGDMLELGEKSEEEHSKIIEKLSELRIEGVMLAGKVFQKVSYGKNVRSFPDVNSLCDYLKIEHPSGYTILVKGSRGTGLEKIYDYL